MSSNQSLPYHQILVPENQEPLGSLIILHGMQEHSGRYIDFAQHLNSKGWVVLLYDHKGHGQTSKSDGISGFFGKKKPHQVLIDDGKKMSELLKKQYPDIPHFIFGHSMGSFITRCVLQEISADFDGAILSGTGARVPGTPLLNMVLRTLNSINPRKQGIWDKLFIAINNRKFKKEPNHQGTNWLSLNPANRDAFISDPFCGQPFTHNGYYGLISVQLRATHRNWATKISKDFPIFFVSGEDDPIGDFGRGVQKTYDNLIQDKFKNITLKLYPKMRHEILNEEIKEEVYSAISDWLKNEVVEKNN